MGKTASKTTGKTPKSVGQSKGKPKDDVDARIEKLEARVKSLEAFERWICSQIPSVDLSPDASDAARSLTGSAVWSEETKQGKGRDHVHFK